MKWTSQAYRLLMGKTVVIDDVEHAIAPVPRNSKIGVCYLCDYLDKCPFEVREVCKLLIPTEDTNFTLKRLTDKYDITQKTDEL